MKVEFTGRHVEVSAAIKKHAQEHLEKLEKVFDFDNGKAHVILEVEKHRHRAEILFRWRDQELAGTAETDDMYTSLTQAADKLERQALKLKEKKTNLKRQSQAIEVVKAPEDNVIEEVAGEAKIVRSSRYAAKPLTAEEAMQEVKESDDQFLVFRDAKTERIAVIYKRKDGNFGLIEP